MKSQPIAILSACLLWCGAIWAQPGGATVDLKVPSEYRIAGITVLGVTTRCPSRQVVQIAGR